MMETDRGTIEREVGALPTEELESRFEQADLVVVTEDGLHLRVASKIVQLCKEFEAAMEIRFNGTIVNAKSLLDLMTLAAERGSRLRVTARGKDAPEALGRLLSSLSPDDLRQIPA